MKGSAMSRLVLLRHRSAVFLLVVAVAWGSWELFLTVTAPGRIDPALRSALEELPPHLREVVILREQEGFSYKEIASIVAVPIGTVMSRLARARSRLLAQLAREEGRET